MECGGHCGGGGGLQPHLARITLLIITGWTLKITSHDGILMVECTSVAVIDRDMNLQYANKADLEPNNLHHIQSNINHNNQDVFLGTTEDKHRDKMETEISFNATQNKATSPVLLIPDYIKDLEDNKQRNNTDRRDIRNFYNVTDAPELEYQPGLVIRCAAKGHPRPNVTWEIDDEKLPLFVASTALTYSPTPRDGSHERDSEEPTFNKSSTTEEVWVDLKLPKFNNAFYGSLRCRAENIYGNASWEVELIHNANSSLFMKVVRVTIATFLLMVTILAIRLILWIDIRRKEKLYERLPPQDLEIIHKFKKGLPPPPTPATSSSVVPSTTTTSCNPSERGVTMTDVRDENECIGEGIEITVNCSDQSSAEATHEGYQSGKHDSYTSEHQHHSLKVKRPLGTIGSVGGGGASTPSSISCSSVHVLDLVNSWTNYVPYDDKLETSSKHFTVDYSSIVESGSYGMVFTGKLRNDINMEWINVAVKCGKTERDDNFLLESLLTELKILASLPKPHNNIINLRGASTKLLHERQVFLFVDHCETGNLATFIDLNRQNFRDATQKTFESESTTTEVRVNEHDGQHEVVISVEGSGSNCQSFSLKELLAWSWQISDGMKFLHKHKVIHGNLNTSNVYLTSKLTAKIGNIGYTPEADVLGHIETASRKYLTVPQFGVERFSRKSDVWDYGYVLWELYSLRQQRCPSREMIFELLRYDEENGDDDDDVDIQSEMDIPQYATEDVFQLMLCCWNEDGTLRPEFHFFSKSFKQLYKGIFVRKKSSESNNAGSGISVV